MGEVFLAGLWVFLYQLSRKPQMRNLYGISVFERHLYVTSWHSNSVLAVHKYNQSDVRTVRANLTRPFSIHVYHRQRKPPGEKASFLSCTVVQACHGPFRKQPPAAFVHLAHTFILKRQMPWKAVREKTKLHPVPTRFIALVVFLMVCRA